MFLLFILNILFALSFTIAKAVLSYGKPLFFVAVRMTTAGIFLVGYILMRYGWRSLRIRSSDYKKFVLFIFMHIYVTYVLDLISLQYMSSFKAAFLYNLSPFITALFSYHYFAETMTFQKIVGLIIGFGGFLPELITAYSQEGKGFLFLSYAELMMIGSVVASCVGWVMLRDFVRRDYDPMMLNGMAMFFGGILTFGTSYIVEQWDIQSPIYQSVPFFGLTFLIILVSNILLYNLYGLLLKKYTATLISFTGFIIPLLAALFGWFFLGEHIGWHFFVSVILVSIGLFLFYREDMRQGYTVL